MSSLLPNVTGDYATIAHPLTGRDLRLYDGSAAERGAG